ncbi:MAG: hypothetical protein JJT85_11555 [Chromatiales bacterium]|nr:hypothetical protein [Chromatiales bacterium]
MGTSLLGETATETTECKFPSGPGGFLRGPLHGALEFEIDWSGPALGCSGMPRPGGQGIRLFFRGPLADSQTLSVVLGIEAGPGPLAGNEWPVTVTLIEDGRGQIYSSAGQARCWTRVGTVSAAGDGIERISGQVYCVGAIPSLVDFSSITLGDFSYAGRVDRATD